MYEAYLYLSGGRVDYGINSRKRPGSGGAHPSVLTSRQAAQLIAQGRSIPMIFMTAFPDENEKARVLNAGAIGFLTKPIAQKTLVECLTRAFAAPNAAYT